MPIMFMYGVYINVMSYFQTRLHHLIDLRMEGWQVPGRRTKTGLQLCSRTIWKRSRPCDSRRSAELKEMRGMSEEVWASWNSATQGKGQCGQHGEEGSRASNREACGGLVQAQPQTGRAELQRICDALGREVQRGAGWEWTCWDKEIKDESKREVVGMKKVRTGEEELKLMIFNIQLQNAASADHFTFD